MTTTPHDSPSREESDQANHRRSGSTWLPIATGVLGGMLIWLVLVSTPTFNLIIHWIYGDMSSKSYVAEYYWILRSALLLMVIIGGGIGTHYSTWPKAKSIMFFLGTVIVVATFAVLGFR